MIHWRCQAPVVRMAYKSMKILRYGLLSTEFSQRLKSPADVLDAHSFENPDCGNEASGVDRRDAYDRSADAHNHVRGFSNLDEFGSHIAIRAIA